MTMPDIPWNKAEYYLDKDEKVIYLRGSFMRSMALHHATQDPAPGYRIRLVHASTLEKLKDNPDYIYELKQIIKEREDAKEERPTDSRGSSSGS